VSQPQQPPASVGAFIAGIVVGFISGGTVITVMALLFGLLIAAALSLVTHDANVVAITSCYVVAVGVGILGFFLVRKNVGFLSGFVIGAAGGLLGGVALCNGIISGLNNMH
jgi:hypothetical protein